MGRPKKYDVARCGICGNPAIQTSTGAYCLSCWPKSRWARVPKFKENKTRGAETADMQYHGGKFVDGEW